VTAVFKVPLTVGVKVVLWPAVSDALVGETLTFTTSDGAVGCNITETDAVLLGSAELAAVTVIVSCDVTLAGAVYSPLASVPTFGVRDQDTPELSAPCTDAVNCADWPARNVVVPWAIEMLTFETVGMDGDRGCASNTVAVAVTLGLAILVAEIVTWDSLLIEGGAV
jgi:hypothetical protein